LPTLQVVGANDRIEIPFDDRWQTDAGSVRLSAAEWQDKLKKRYGLEIDFGTGYLSSGHRNISSTERGLDAGIVGVNRTQTELCLDVVPKELTDIKAGRYTGTISVMAGSDGRSLVSVPVTLTFRASRWLALGVALLGISVGLALKALSEAAAMQRENGDSANELSGRRALRASILHPRFGATLILGLVAAAFVFQRVYIGDGAWGESSSDFMELFGLCFIAQLSSSEAVAVIRRWLGSGGSPTVPVPPIPGSV
jgi:hypothetical protein